MITFKQISWRNFLSTGNTETKINFQKSPTTLIIGQNGAGKSTILDALTFCLFGKPFRKINKPQLVNSVNQKNCLVVLDFNIGKHEFTVKRGIKPGVFEIWKNGVLLDQDAKVKDMQEQLEKQVLKLNYKTFTQVVILGSSTFVPFMQLSNNDRREIIENILDIQVFTTMNTILKNKMAALKTHLDNLDNKIFTTEEKISLQESHMKRNDETRKEQILGYQETIDENNDQASKILKENLKLTKKIDKLISSTPEKKPLSSKMKKMHQIHTKLSHKMETVQETIEFFHDNEVCPTCSQDIEEDFKHTAISENKKEVEKYKKGILELNEEVKKIEEEIEKINVMQLSIDELQQQLNKNNNTLSSINQYISKLNISIENLKKLETTSIDKEELKQFKESVEALEEEKKKLLTTRHYLDLAGLLLKDTGIKTRIVKKYLPHMNKLINQYLTALDFYVKFTLDENFNETIKSRHRDIFSYSSFSEGEKTRINLALLFAWRSIAKMKSSVNTNLLILDEVFDSSLDETGVDDFMKLLKAVSGNTNVFIISHRGDMLVDKFADTIEFTKEGNFSKPKITSK